MLFNGPITEAARYAASTRLPQAIFVGSPHDQLEFTKWNAINGFDQIAVISIVTKGSVEEAQLDAVVREKGIVPRLHIIPPVGRGLTPTCLFNQGLKEELVSQALATAGGLMMSYTDVMENIARNYISEEVQNANKETKRGLASGAASPPNLPVANSSGFTSPTSAVASPSSSSAAAGARLAPSAVLTSPQSASTAAAGASSSSSPPTLNLPNFKLILKVLADGTSHTVYTNNLWNAAAQLSKGKPFSLETGRSDNLQRATKAEELRMLPLTEGTIVRLTHDTATGPSAGATPLGSPSSSSPTAASRSTPSISEQHVKAVVGSSSSPSAAPQSTSSSAASNSNSNALAPVEIRFTLPTGAVQQLSFNPSDTLAHVRQQVSEKFLGASNTEMATYCQANGLSQKEFTLAVAYPPKRLENTAEMNSKTIADLKLGSKFALRVVMAFVGGGGAQPQHQQPQQGGTITGSIGGVLGRMGGWMRGNGNDSQ